MALRKTKPAMVAETRAVSLRLVRDEAHYREIFEKAIASCRVSVWISTANLKDVHIEAPIGTRARARGKFISAFERLSDLAKNGIDVRILYAGVPSGPLRQTIQRLGEHRVKLRRCPRVHLKMVAVDGAFLYLGSANFTGAGLGAKGDGRRNFEAGIVTDDEMMLDEMQRTFFDIWSGRKCGGCRLRAQCPAPLDAA